MHVVGSTPKTPASSLARANLVYDEGAKKELLDKDWRLEEVPYEREPKVPGFACWRDQHGPFPEWVNEVLCRKVEDLILNGSSVLAAKHLAGINTVRWRAIVEGARAERDPYVTFLGRLRKAEEHAVVHCERTIAAASEHPDAAIAAKYAQKRLEIMRPGRWLPALKSKVDVNIRGQVSVQQVNVLANVSGEDLARLFAARQAQPQIVGPTSATALFATETAPTSGVPASGAGDEDDE